MVLLNLHTSERWNTESAHHRYNTFLPILKNIKTIDIYRVLCAFNKSKYSESHEMGEAK